MEQLAVESFILLHDILNRCESDFINSKSCIVFKHFYKLQRIILRGVFRILILRVLSVNRIFPLRVLTAGAISLFLNITGAIALVAPVLNTPLLSCCSSYGPYTQN